MLCKMRTTLFWCDDRCLLGAACLQYALVSMSWTSLESSKRLKKAHRRLALERGLRVTSQGLDDGMLFDKAKIVAGYFGS